MQGVQLYRFRNVGASATVSDASSLPVRGTPPPQLIPGRAPNSRSAFPCLKDREIVHEFCYVNGGHRWNLKWGMIGHERSRASPDALEYFLGRCPEGATPRLRKIWAPCLISGRRRRSWTASFRRSPVITESDKYPREAPSLQGRPRSDPLILKEFISSGRIAPPYRQGFGTW
jgi:hypothetical protein